MTDPSEMTIRIAKAMIPVFCYHGLPISCPDDGDMDGVERERWDCLVEAASAALLALPLSWRERTMKERTEAWNSSNRDLISAVGLLFLDAMSVRCEPSSYAETVIRMVRAADPKTFTAEQVRDMLRLRCNEDGSMRAWGREHNITGSFISQVLSGRANVTDAVARELGLSRVELWEVDSDRALTVDDARTT